MPYGVMLYFDVQTEETISNIWQSLAKHDLSSSMLDAGIRPHLTLAIYEELDCRPCENELVKITSNTPSPSIMFLILAYSPIPSLLSLLRRS